MDKESQACYSGYILQTLANVKRELNDIRHYNFICPVMDEETKIMVGRIEYAIESVFYKTRDKVMNRHGVLLFPDDEIDWKRVEEDCNKMNGGRL